MTCKPFFHSVTIFFIRHLTALFFGIPTPFVNDIQITVIAQANQQEYSRICCSIVNCYPSLSHTWQFTYCMLVLIKHIEYDALSTYPHAQNVSLKEHATKHALVTLFYAFR